MSEPTKACPTPKLIRKTTQSYCIVINLYIGIMLVSKSINQIIKKVLDPNFFFRFPCLQAVSIWRLYEVDIDKRIRGRINLIMKVSVAGTGRYCPDFVMVGDEPSDMTRPLGSL